MLYSQHMASFTVENYLKALYGLSLKTEGWVSTTAIAEQMDIKAATVTDMLKKLHSAGLIHYKKYQGTTLSETGKELAINVIRKHRLWEVFLVNQLQFNWDEVHDMAEELEHIQSLELINRLDAFLSYPKFDPHGDPIPDRHGNIERRSQVPLSQLQVGEKAVVTGVKDSSTDFLRYLDAQEIGLGTELKVEQLFDFDQSRVVSVSGKELTFSQQVSNNLLVQKQS